MEKVEDLGPIFLCQLLKWLQWLSSPWSIPPAPFPLHAVSQCDAHPAMAMITVLSAAGSVLPCYC